jgi:hypothetical protein
MVWLSLVEFHIQTMRFHDDEFLLTDLRGHNMSEQSCTTAVEGVEERELHRNASVLPVTFLKRREMSE